MFDCCAITYLQSSEVILRVERFKNMYIADLDLVPSYDLTCLSAQGKNVDLWHIRHVHVSSSLLCKFVTKDLACSVPNLQFLDIKICDVSFLLLNNLVTKDLVCSVSKFQFLDIKIYDACIKGKQTWSSLKQKKQASTTGPLEQLQMNLCGFIKFQSRGGNNYILVIMMISQGAHGPCS